MVDHIGRNAANYGIPDLQLVVCRVIMGSIVALVSKWIVTRKRWVVERRRVEVFSLALRMEKGRTKVLFLYYLGAFNLGAYLVVTDYLTLNVCHRCGFSLGCCFIHSLYNPMRSCAILYTEIVTQRANIRTRSPGWPTKSAMHCSHDISSPISSGRHCVYSVSAS